MGQKVGKTDGTILGSVVRPFSRILVGRVGISWFKRDAGIAKAF
ncbi:hypothetical protein TDIS_1807 [Thermosulfurimonas dismutans]|uniref:Uncharacterized protein n=1 Tax=Thermosulfurimonas dismutans TaxID=999894 RepID=A0A179D3N3_9BACT|nr:hypothetical protein TDIS_1807 [Thermosulfurimonas dismutans]